MLITYKSDNLYQYHEINPGEVLKTQQMKV